MVCTWKVKSIQMTPWLCTITMPSNTNFWFVSQFPNNANWWDWWYKYTHAVFANHMYTYMYTKFIFNVGTRFYLCILMWKHRHWKESKHYKVFKTKKNKKLKYIKSQTAVPQIPPARTMMGFWCQDSLPGFQLHFAKQNFIEILHPSELDCKGKTRWHNP